MKDLLLFKKLSETLHNSFPIVATIYVLIFSSFFFGFMTKMFDAEVLLHNKILTFLILSLPIVFGIITLASRNVYKYLLYRNSDVVEWGCDFTSKSHAITSGGDFYKNTRAYRKSFTVSLRKNVTIVTMVNWQPHRYINGVNVAASVDKTMFHSTVFCTPEHEIMCRFLIDYCDMLIPSGHTTHGFDLVVVPENDPVWDLSSLEF